MITLTELFERANEWLRNNSRLPLNSDEIVHLINKIAGVLSRDEKGKTYDVDSVRELERDIVISFCINFVRLRNLWELPKSIPWRGIVIEPDLIP